MDPSKNTSQVQLSPCFTNEGLIRAQSNMTQRQSSSQRKPDFLYFTQRNRQNACMEDAKNQIKVMGRKGQKQESVKFKKSFNKKFKIKTKYSDMKSFAAYKQQQAQAKNASRIRLRCPIAQKENPCLGTYEVQTGLIYKRVAKNQTFYTSYKSSYEYAAQAIVKKRQTQSAHQSRLAKPFEKDINKNKGLSFKVRSFDMAKQLPREKVCTQKAVICDSEAAGQSVERRPRKNPFMAVPLTVLELNGSLTKYHRKYKISPCKNLKSKNYREIADRSNLYEGVF